MENNPAATERRPVWFVGAAFGGHDDQTDRFLRDGIWVNGHTDKFIDDVKSIAVGDKIVIKSSYTKKHDLPFDNRGHSVSTMRIKAVGEVTENMEDGRHLRVDWRELDPPREWYFYTNLKTVWKVQHGSGAQPYAAAALIRFALSSKDQDIEEFRNLPFWRERFGDIEDGIQRFGWTGFYSEIADKLVRYRNNRQPLVSGIRELTSGLNAESRICDTYDENGTQGPLRDICPFTAVGLYNCSVSDNLRKPIADGFSALLGLQRSTPNFGSHADGIPLLDYSYPSSWYFKTEAKRKPDDIDKLWRVFCDSIDYAKLDDDSSRDAMERSYNEALLVKNVSERKLTMGLYWMRPWSFPSLDKKTRTYIHRVLGESIPEKFTGTEYLVLRDRLLDRFHDEECPVHSFPELSLAAFRAANESETTVTDSGVDVGYGPVTGNEASVASVKGTGHGTVYSVDDILAEGCFFPRAKLEVALRRLRKRKNLILQGPPGTGKTWLAKRLAYALIGRKEDRLVGRFQFHPNLSYEDFVRGHRPEAGELDLVDGPFLKVIATAQNDPDNECVVVVEEINRGNPAQIFGEMLTLLESDKRNKDEALALAIPRDDNERVYIPPNVYVIGTMNVADRSLALVDLALRRRFTFVDLEPTFGNSWRRWMREQGGVDDSQLRKIEQRMTALNEAIAADQSLGDQFRVGHSYVTTPRGASIDDAASWFREVVDTEIAPLLREYWFDDTKTADDQARRLLEDF